MKQIHTQIDEAIADAIQRIADERKWSFSQAVRELLREAIDSRTRAATTH